MYCIRNKKYIVNNHRTSSSRQKSNIFYVLKFKKKKNKSSNDITECCIVGYKYSIVGYISIYSNKDFSSRKNDQFDFQLAQLSNELEIFYAVFSEMIHFGSSISILQLH